MSGLASGNHSLHRIFFRRKTIRGLERFHSTVATSASFLHATTVVRFELLEMEKRDWPDALTTTELTMLDLPRAIVSLTDGRSLWYGVLTRVELGEVGGGGTGL